MNEIILKEQDYKLIVEALLNKGQVKDKDVVRELVTNYPTIYLKIITAIVDATNKTNRPIDLEKEEEITSYYLGLPLKSNITLPDWKKLWLKRYLDMKSMDKLAAIRYIRGDLGLGLNEAKILVEVIRGEKQIGDVNFQGTNVLLKEYIGDYFESIKEIKQ